MKQLRNIILTSFVMAILGIAITSCTECPETLPGTGITGQTWSDVNQADIEGELLSFDFTAEDSWTAFSKESWCKVVTTEGQAGVSTLRIKVAANGDQFGRTATVTIQVANREQPCVITIQQGDGFIEQGDGKYREANQWIYDIMDKYYLWNEPIPSLVLDYSIEYMPFLTSMLDGIGKAGNVNKEDGYYKDGQRVAYFTTLASNAPMTQEGLGDVYTDSGILKLQATKFNVSATEVEVGFAIIAVTPGSEADKAGIKRGDFINEVDGVEVNENNYSNLAGFVYDGNVSVKVNEVKFTDGIATVTYRETIDLGYSTYEDQPIYAYKVIENKDYGKKVGYLLYMYFDMNHDGQLISVFDSFKNENINELVIDLRFNNGGHVLSSTLLGTLVAGEEYKGQIYTRSVYNSERTTSGEVGQYRIGMAANPEMEEGYSYLVEALASAVNLKKVYLIVSGTTASASELLINGLRGLDIEVNLVGTKTLGKNVGMEGFQSSFRNYTFILYPVSFYCENAKGFHSYSGGFTPDLEADDSIYYPGEFGTSNDYLCRHAITWAITDTKPTITTASYSSAPAYVEVLPLPGPDRIRDRHPDGSFTIMR